MEIEYSESIVVELFITEPEDIDLIKHNLENLKMGSVLEIKPDEKVKSAFRVRLMMETISHLYLLGRYVGCDRKRIYDKDF